ncbi:YcjX family protein [Aliiglaciecola sp. LCG003]|uniref:YcjX family protein n=1 Tax=Aliiglaciecola sp. LCG003 TaxID=3053655 RepID=UPI0025722E1A|nr:YcjX family protein [Aliiglaciecola sp. LCG003]WJG08367.1 YcjX family protein [Aliiglaciecola sp. LCG003]
MDLLNKLTQHTALQRLQNQVKVLGNRIADHHVSLAVTGLSKSGKTAFITSLLNQLLNARESADLPFFSVVKQGRLIGVKRDVQPDVTVARFAYEKGLENLTQTPPVWPESTAGVSQVRLLIKYRNQSKLRRLVSEFSTLTLDITDYPGEWLLDLPLLELDYQQWCEQFWQDVHDITKSRLAEPFKQAISGLDIESTPDEMQLQSISTLFSDFLLQCKAHGFQLIQPGRFVLPGELAGAPVLQFFPLTPEQLTSITNQSVFSSKETVVGLLSNRFEQYQKKVIKPFYSKHFKRFDRQIVLVDCLSALNQGAHSFNDLRKAVNWLLGSFHYGKSNILKRLFSPNIDKLMFAASKADHITPAQQHNLVLLLESIVHEARQQIQYEGVVTESTAFSAIRASKSGTAEVNGKTLQVLRGTDLNGKKITLFPGDVPSVCPDDSFWQQQGFQFPAFAPMPLEVGQQTFPHIRLDHVLEFVLGDKME